MAQEDFDRLRDLGAMYEAMASASFSAARTGFGDDWWALQKRVGDALQEEHARRYPEGIAARRMP